MNQLPSAPSSPSVPSAPSDLQFPLPVITWDTVRESMETVRAIGKKFVAGQCWIGWQLAAMKKARCVKEGRPSKNSASLAEFLPWNALVEQETGLPRRTADYLIKLFEASLAKLRRTKGALIGKAALLVFERENPLDITDQEAAELFDLIASLCDGETQASLMLELGVIPKPPGMPKGGGKPKTGDEPTAGQMAFVFFETMLAPIVNTRCSPDYKKLLHVLPPYSTQDNPVSLDAIATECRAILADIAEVQAAHAKPAKGRAL